MDMMELLLLYQYIRFMILWPSVQGVGMGVKHMSGTSRSHRTKTISRLIEFCGAILGNIKLHQALNIISCLDEN